MNRHLEIIFIKFLPEVSKAGIPYWVYGGIAIAAIAGKFLRKNDDVDVFVLNDDFSRTQVILKKICRLNKDCIFGISNENNKLKLKVYIPHIQKKEVLSIMPVYKTNTMIEFRFLDGFERFDEDILERVERKINNYKFFTPTDSSIRKLFCYYLTVLKRNGKIKRDNLRKKYKIDAKEILTPKEYNRFFDN